MTRQHANDGETRLAGLFFPQRVGVRVSVSVSIGVESANIDENVGAGALTLTTSSRSALARTLTVWPWHIPALHACAVARVVMLQVTHATVRAGLGCTVGFDDG